MCEEKKFAEQLTKKPAIYSYTNLTKKHVITYKGEINIVTEADKMSEDLIINEIGKNSTMEYFRRNHRL